jgi:catechol 2,3-dioxygenase-like lactoylglutathione lyase family enzyme
MSSTMHQAIILAVSDLPQSVRFYREAFGWPVVVDESVYVEFQLPDNLRLGLYERAAFGANTGQTPFAVPVGQLTGTELYFYADDVAAAIEQLRAAGARELSALALRGWGDEAAYFADPDGNVLVVARRVEGAAA